MGTEGVFSKLRAGLLLAGELAGDAVGERETTALPASLLRCAAALSFLAPGLVTGGALVWGALEGIGTPRNKNRSIYNTFNLPKQIHRIRRPYGLF